ncbi:trypsin inhibitor like cysteine rich domain-containing protein [Phthorimaea operculella]|nr:trypsin inhibitor like cysteine rich domain-containing protein [Phthorimaea operculella]
MASYKLYLIVLLSVVAAVVAKPADADPPPLDCPENEMYLKCQLEQCFKTCNHLLNMPPCPSIVSGCVDQACVCKGGYKRNAEGVCVPEDQCPEWPQVLERNEKFGFVAPGSGP